MLDAALCEASASLAAMAIWFFQPEKMASRSQRRFRRSRPRNRRRWYCSAPACFSARAALKRKRSRERGGALDCGDAMRQHGQQLLTRHAGLEARRPRVSFPRCPSRNETRGPSPLTGTRSVLRVPLDRHLDVNRLRRRDRELGAARQRDVLALRHQDRGRARAAPDSRADRCAFAAADDRANDRAARGGEHDLVRVAILGRRRHHRELCVDGVRLAVRRDVREVHAETRTPFYLAGRFDGRDDAAHGAAGRQHLNAVDRHRVGERRADGVSDLARGRAHWLPDPDGDLRAGGYRVLAELRDRGQPDGLVVRIDDANIRDVLSRDRPRDAADVHLHRLRVTGGQLAFDDAAVLTRELDLRANRNLLEVRPAGTARSCHDQHRRQGHPSLRHITSRDGTFFHRFGPAGARGRCRPLAPELTNLWKKVPSPPVQAGCQSCPKAG